MPAAWQAWFDGSALPNPGRMGIGFVLRAPDGACHERSFAAHEPGCNNEAELHALCALLEFAQAQGVRRLQVYGDSDVAVRYATGIDATEVARLHLLVMRTQALLDGFEHVGLNWVPRHRNGTADELSRKALGLAPKPAAWPGRKR
jgi:ribonuclease HI